MPPAVAAIGVTAVSVTPLNGVQSVTCTPLNSSGALLTCTVNLTNGLSPGASNGAASFQISALAPSTIPSSGTITNYASVDPTGGFSPPATGPGCAPSSSCGSATSSIVSSPSYTLSKTATSPVSPSGSVSYTINLGNSGLAASAANWFNLSASLSFSCCLTFSLGTNSIR